MRLTLQTKELLRLALQEDVQHGDRTTDALCLESDRVQAVINVNEDAVICGSWVAKEIFRMVDPELDYECLVQDGTVAAAGADIARISGPADSIMVGERTALNLLMRLSGIATMASKYVDTVRGTDVILLDTRKTTPGLRDLEKAAASCGGFRNHRFSLDGGVLIKDNHLVLAGGVKQAIDRLRKHGIPILKIEVEVKTLQEAEQAVAAGADALLLDNMDPAMVKSVCSALKNKVFLEVSGGINLQNIRQFALAGPHAISTSAIFKFSRWTDMSLNIRRL